MAPEPIEDTIRTVHLELVPLTTRFVDAVVAGDATAAGAEVGATVGRWLTADPSHVIQLHLAGQAAEARGYPGLGRILVLVTPSRDRRVIGSIGFHGPPDDRGRLEASCRLHPAQRSRGLAAEAFGALLDWSTARFGVTRFLVAVPSRSEYREPIPIDVAVPAAQPNEAQMDHIATLVGGKPAFCADPEICSRLGD